MSCNIGNGLPRLTRSPHTVAVVRSQTLISPSPRLPQAKYGTRRIVVGALST